MFVPKSFSDKGVVCVATEPSVLTEEKVGKFKESNVAAMEKPVAKRAKDEEPTTISKFLDKLLLAANHNGGQVTVDDIKDASGMSQLLPNTGSGEFQSVIRVLMTKGYVTNGKNISKSSTVVDIDSEAF